MILESLLNLKNHPKHFKLSSLYPFKNNIGVQKLNECLIEALLISKFCSQKQDTESLTPLVYAMNEMN